MMNGFNDGMGAGGWVLMSVFWVALVAAIVWAVAAVSSRAPHPGTVAGAPLDVLDHRLVSGEIDEETYDALRRKLGDSGSGRV